MNPSLQSPRDRYRELKASRRKRERPSEPSSWEGVSVIHVGMALTGAGPGCFSSEDESEGGADGVKETPMMLVMLAIICVSTGGVMDSAYAPEWPRKRSRSISDFAPAMYPPAAPNDLVNVPMRMSIDRGGILK